MSRDAYKRYTSEGSWRYDVVLPGFKYNMPDIQAAIGLHQLKRLDEMQRRRRADRRAVRRSARAAGRARDAGGAPDVESAWHIYLLRLRRERLRIDRDSFIDGAAQPQHRRERALHPDPPALLLPATATASARTSFRSPSASSSGCCRCR